MKNLFSFSTVRCFALLNMTTALLLLFSCKNKTDYSKEIFRLDSAGIVLAEAEKILLLVDTSALRSSYNSSAEHLHFITEKFSKDTVKKKTAMFLSDAYEQSGNIRNLLDNKKYLEQAIRESQQRISNLKHDLIEELIEKNKSAEYVVNEMNALHKIYEAVNNAIEKAKVSSMKLDSLKTQIIFLADSLNLRKTK